MEEKFKVHPSICEGKFACEVHTAFTEAKKQNKTGAINVQLQQTVVN